MRTDNAMKTLNAARRAIGLSAQGIGCSQVVINTTLKQLERDVGGDLVPKTVSVLKSMLDNKGLASEKAATLSMDEINAMRDSIRIGMAAQDKFQDVRQESESDDIEPPRAS